MPHTPWSWGRDLFLGMTFTYISTLVAYSRTKLVSPSNYNEAADERANELCQPCDENHKKYEWGGNDIDGAASPTFRCSPAFNTARVDVCTTISAQDSNLRRFLELNPGFATPRPPNPITCVMNLLAIRWLVYVETMVAVGKMALLMVIILSSFALSNYAHQNRQFATDRESHGQTIQRFMVSHLAKSPNASPEDNADFHGSFVSQYWTCGLPQLTGSMEANQEALRLHHMGNLFNNSTPSILQTIHRAPRYKVGRNPQLSLMGENGKDHPIEHNVKVHDIGMEQIFFFSVSGLNWQSTCSLIPTTPLISLNAALLIVPVYSVTIALFCRVVTKTKDQFVIISALFTCMGVWVGSNGPSNTNERLDLEFVLLAILPWCIAIPLCLQYFIQIRRGLHHRSAVGPCICTEKRYCSHNIMKMESQAG